MIPPGLKIFYSFLQILQKQFDADICLKEKERKIKNILEQLISNLYSNFALKIINYMSQLFNDQIDEEKIKNFEQEMKEAKTKIQNLNFQEIQKAFQTFHSEIPSQNSLKGYFLSLFLGRKINSVTSSFIDHANSWEEFYVHLKTLLQSLFLKIDLHFLFPRRVSNYHKYSID